MFGLILTKVKKLHKIEVKCHTDIRCMSNIRKLSIY